MYDDLRCFTCTGDSPHHDFTLNGTLCSLLRKTFQIILGGISHVEFYIQPLLVVGGCKKI